MKGWRNCLIGLSAMLVVLSILSTQAAAEYTAGAAGGTGGTHTFTRRCPAGQSMIGIKVKAGSFIDEIAPICWRVRGNSWFDSWSRFTGEKTLTTGTNPTPTNRFYTRYCPGNALVAGLKLKAGIYVDRVMTVRCQQINGAQLTYRGMGAGGDGGTVKRLYCGSGDHVKYFKLNFGRWIDRAEVFCE